MADKRISELPNLSAIEDSALLVVEFNGVAYNLTGKQFKDFAASVAGSGGSSSGGSGGGDMLKTTYDPDGAVAAAGGIAAYVQQNGGGISMDEVEEYLSGVVGDIDSLLDDINGEVV